MFQTPLKPISPSNNNQFIEFKYKLKYKEKNKMIIRLFPLKLNLFSLSFNESELFNSLSFEGYSRINVF